MSGGLRGLGATGLQHLMIQQGGQVSRGAESSSGTGKSPDKIQKPTVKVQSGDENDVNPGVILPTVEI